MRAPLQPGELNRRITIQQKSVARDAYGAEVITWVNVGTVWARRRPLSGREYAAVQAAQAARGCAYDCRYRAGVSPAMRVLEGSRVSEINLVDEIDPELHYMTLVCTDYAGTL